MGEQLPALIVATPLLFSFPIYLVGLWRRELCYPLFLISLILNAAFSLWLFFRVVTLGPISYPIGGWEPPWGIEYRVDHLSALVIASVATVALLVGLSFKGRVEGETEPSRRSQIYALFSLQLCGLLGMTVTGDVFNLYVLLEIASFSAYAIIAMGERGAEFFAFRYLIFGTIGACCYLLGVGHLYILTGSLNMADLSRLLPPLYPSRALLVGFALLVLGVGIKMAAFPLHTWLPDAYTQAPSSASAFLAPLSTKVASYVFLRILTGIFSPRFSLTSLSEAMGWVALAGAIFASLMALAQGRLRRVLCYLIISEISFLLMGVASRTTDGLRGAVLHLVNDMFMMGCLFTGACAILHQLGREELVALKGLCRKMPLTSAALLLGGLSIIGTPPLCGFFSKWYLVLGAIEARMWHIVIGLLVGSLLNTIVVFRLLEKIYLGTGHQHGQLHWDGLPKGMAMGLVFFSLSLILLGIFASEIVARAIDPWISL